MIGLAGADHELFRLHGAEAVDGARAAQQAVEERLQHFARHLAPAFHDRAQRLIAAPGDLHLAPDEPVDRAALHAVAALVAPAQL